MTTAPDRIDAARALELLRAAVAQDGYGPNYVYPRNGRRCQYARDDAPSCLVGHALALGGVTVGRLREIDAAGPPGALFLGEYVSTVTEEAARVFDDAQQEQDRAATWGVALAAADAKARQFI